nr:tyrosine-type recombinase/integrase [Devosia indica]
MRPSPGTAQGSSPSARRKRTERRSADGGTACAWFVRRAGQCRLGRLYVPCTPALKDMLDRMDRNAAVIMSTKTGRAWQKRYFAEQWDEASKAAGITDLHFHDLRGTAVTMLAEAGCSVPEIASITGHSLKSVHTILEKYMSRTRALAKSAMTKFENASSTDFANRLQTVDRTEARRATKLLK